MWETQAQKATAFWCIWRLAWGESSGSSEQKVNQENLSQTFQKVVSGWKAVTGADALN